MKEILEDMVELQVKTDFAILEINNKITRAIQTFLNGKILSEDALKQLKLELYLEYTKRMREQLFKYIVILSDSFVKIDTTYALIKDTDRKIFEIESSALDPHKSIPKLKELITGLIEEYNKLTDNETSLKWEAWNIFFFKYYCIIMLAITGAYASLMIYKTSLNGWQIFGIWVLVAIFSYYVIKFFYRMSSLSEEIKEAHDKLEES